MTLPILVADAAQTTAQTAAPKSVDLNPVDLVLHATGPVFAIFWMLVAMAAAGWFAFYVVYKLFKGQG